MLTLKFLNFPGLIIFLGTIFLVVPLHENNPEVFTEKRCDFIIVYSIFILSLFYEHFRVTPKLLFLPLWLFGLIGLNVQVFKHCENYLFVISTILSIVFCYHRLTNFRSQSSAQPNKAIKQMGESTNVE